MTKGTLNLFLSRSPGETSADLFGVVTVSEDTILDMLRSVEDLGSARGSTVSIKASLKGDTNRNIIVVGRLENVGQKTDSVRTSGMKDPVSKLMLFPFDGSREDDLYGFMILTEKDLVESLKSVRGVYQEGGMANISVSCRVREDKNKMNYISGKCRLGCTENAEYLKLALPVRKTNPFLSGVTLKDVLNKREEIKSGHVFGGTEDVPTPPESLPKTSTRIYFD
jgi:hypothetical protein